MPKKELITVALVEEEVFLRTTLAELIGLMGGYRVVLPRHLPRSLRRRSLE